MWVEGRRGSVMNSFITGGGNIGIRLVVLEAK